MYSYYMVTFLKFFDLDADTRVGKVLAQVTFVRSFIRLSYNVQELQAYEVRFFPYIVSNFWSFSQSCCISFMSYIVRKVLTQVTFLASLMNSVLLDKLTDGRILCSSNPPSEKDSRCFEE